MRKQLVPLLKARALYAYGKQNDYFDHGNTIGWTREGDDEHENSGLACILTTGNNAWKTMYVGEKFKNQLFYDITGNRSELILIGEDGTATFFCNDGSVSVWVKKNIEIEST